MGHPLIVRPPFFLFVGCSNNLGLINKEDVEQIRKGEDLDSKAFKTALSLVNLCSNMTNIRHEPTMAAMSFVRSLTNDEYNVNHTLRKKSSSSFTTTTTTEEENSGDKEGEVEPKRRRVESEIVNKKTSTVKHELTSTVNVPGNFDLDDFVQVLADDNDDFLFPEFEIVEGRTEDMKPLDE